MFLNGVNMTIGPDLLLILSIILKGALRRILHLIGIVLRETLLLIALIIGTMIVRLQKWVILIMICGLKLAIGCIIVKLNVISTIILRIILRGKILLGTYSRMRRQICRIHLIRFILY